MAPNLKMQDQSQLHCPAPERWPTIRFSYHARPKWGSKIWFVCKDSAKQSQRKIKKLPFALHPHFTKINAPRLRRTGTSSVPPFITRLKVNENLFPRSPSPPHDGKADENLAHPFPLLTFAVHSRSGPDWIWQRVGMICKHAVRLEVGTLISASKDLTGENKFALAA